MRRLQRRIPVFIAPLPSPGTLLLPLLLAFAGACSDPPALSVGEVDYAEEEVLAFDNDRMALLTEITALGIAVSRGELEELGKPVKERRIREALLNLLERHLRVEFAGLDEADLRARYAQGPQYELTVRHLVILVDEWATEDGVDSARARARAARERIQAGEPFPEVAGEVSEEPGARERGGLLEPAREGAWVDEFWTAASALEVGEVSPVIRTPYGFHVLRLEDREPVPFEEARHWAIEEVARSLPRMVDKLREWSDSVKAPVEVDSATLAQELARAGSPFALATEGFLAEHPDSAVARWPGGEYTAGEFRTFLLSRDRQHWANLSRGGVGTLLRVVRDAAGRKLLEGIARDRGLSVTPAIEASIRRDWDNGLARLGATLGFREGMSTNQVKATALEAVRDSGQGARLARRELHDWSALLRTAYPVRSGEEEEAPG